MRATVLRPRGPRGRGPAASPARPSVGLGCPAATAVPPLLVSALVALAGLAAAPGPAVAEVVLSPVANGPGLQAEVKGPTVVAPDGARRTLASSPIEPEDGYAVPVLSPDHRFVARTHGARAVLVPTAGGPFTSLVASGVRNQLDTTVWWDADGSHMLVEGPVDRTGRPVLQRCAVASGTCDVSSTRDRDLLGPLASGASLWARPEPDATIVALRNDALEGWIGATPRSVSRARRAIRLRVPSRLILVAADAGSSRVLLRRDGSYARGIDGYSVESDPAPAGTLVEHVRTTHRVLTRRKAGRLQLRIRARQTERRWLRITDDGAIRPIPVRSAEGDDPSGVVIVAGQDGWLVPTTSRRGVALIGTMDTTGRLRRLTVDGAPLTTETLHAALGLPAGAAPRADAIGSGFRPAGVEAATNSAIVTYVDDDDDRTVVARVPLDGGDPTLVDRRVAEYGLHVTAW